MTDQELQNLRTLIDSIEELADLSYLDKTTFLNKKNFPKANGILTYQGIYISSSLVYQDQQVAIGRAVQILNGLDSLAQIGRPYSDFKEILYGDGIDLKLSISQGEILLLTDLNAQNVPMASGKLLTSTESVFIRGMVSISQLQFGKDVSIDECALAYGVRV